MLSILLTFPISFATSATATNYTSDTLMSTSPGLSYSNTAFPLIVSSQDVISPMPSRWRNYALASITPHFSFTLIQSEADALPRVTDAVIYKTDIPLNFEDSAKYQASRFIFSVASNSVSDTPAATHAFGDLIGVSEWGLQRYVATPSLVQSWGDDGLFGVSAVLAYQRFASLGLGAVAWREGSRPSAWTTQESSFGSGVRFDFGNVFAERVSWDASYQSRVNMDAFNNYRGVFSEPGDFDIPANVNFDMGYALTSALGIQFGVQRVMYSAITPFTSASLPTRFLALLGDGTSPAFQWRDLTVYSIGGTWHNAVIGDIELRYTTCQQPSPTSALLEQALASEMAHDNISLGFSHATSANSRLSLLASYASAPYFLGVPTYRLRNDATADQLEFEALWTAHF